jgi:hypothetical protein
VYTSWNGYRYFENGLNETYIIIFSLLRFSRQHAIETLGNSFFNRTWEFLVIAFSLLQFRSLQWRQGSNGICCLVCSMLLNVHDFLHWTVPSWIYYHWTIMYSSYFMHDSHFLHKVSNEFCSCLCFDHDPWVLEDVPVRWILHK